ncbi:hypothetical protein C8J57DRAFT_638856 [Mycena rebaudengoi]|nr:hypothetical protein C8J57DRAFT_638856 [Mycena rebaudengoi]
MDPEGDRRRVMGRTSSINWRRTRHYFPRPEMSSMGEASLSFISSSLPNNTANKIIGVSILTAITALGIHHISPTRLTRVLVALMDETDTSYIRAVEAGLVFCDVDADALFKLQIKVSRLHEESLRNSLSTPKMLAEFFRGRSLVLYQCIRDAQDLKTRIEISKEEQLRNLNPTGAGTAAWTMSARRRHVHPPGSRCHCGCI